MSGRTRLRRLSWLLMAVVFVVALVYGSVDDGGARSDSERAADLAASIACPQCTGQPVAESNAPIAQVIRTEIKQQVDAGLSDAEIRAVYVARYGEWVDLNPSRTGLTSVVWIAPFLAVGVALGGLALAFSRWKGLDTRQQATAEDHEIVSGARER